MYSKAQIITKLADLFNSIDEVEFAFLFGSTAKGRLTPITDMDVAVYLNDKVDLNSYGRLRIRLIGDVMDILKMNSVDLIILNDCSPLLKYEVQKHGILLVCKNPEKKVEFFVKTIKEYCDTKPMREFQIKASKQRLKKGVKRGSSRGFAESLERIRGLFS